MNKGKIWGLICGLHRPRSLGKSTMPTFNRAYADAMRHHRYGLALLEPVSSHSMRPGSVGFFGANGSWNSIASLDDADSLDRAHLRASATELERMPRDEALSLDPKISSDVIQQDGEFSKDPE